MRYPLHHSVGRTGVAIRRSLLRGPGLSGCTVVGNRHRPTRSPSLNIKSIVIEHDVPDALRSHKALKNSNLAHQQLLKLRTWRVGVRSFPHGLLEWRAQPLSGSSFLDPH